MTEGVTISGLEEVRSYLNSLPEKLFDKTKEVFRERTLAAHREVSNNLTGSPLKSRTGLLLKSIRPTVSGKSLESLKAGVFAARFQGGTEVVYAPIHEYGGTVTAKNAYKRVQGGPYLNIPAKANQTAAGVMRKPPGEVFSEGGYIAKMRSGNHGVFLDGRLMFSLVKSVDIKARLGMRDAMADEIPTLISQLKGLKL